MNKILTLLILLWVNLNLIAQSAQPCAIMTNHERSFEYQVYNAYTLDNKLVKVVVNSSNLQSGEIVNAYYSYKTKTYEEYPTGIHELCIDMPWNTDTLATPIAVVNNRVLYRIELPNGRTEILSWDTNYTPLYDGETVPVIMESTGNGIYIAYPESKLVATVRSRNWIRPVQKIKT